MVEKFFPLPQPEEKALLEGNRRRSEARSTSPGFERSEIDVRRQILLTGRGIELLGGAMVLVRKKRAAHVVIVKEVARGMAVVDREHVSACQPAPNFRDPIARFEPRFGVLGFA